MQQMLPCHKSLVNCLREGFQNVNREESDFILYLLPKKAWMGAIESDISVPLMTLVMLVALVILQAGNCDRLMLRLSHVRNVQGLILC